MIRLRTGGLLLSCWLLLASFTGSSQGELQFLTAGSTPPAAAAECALLLSSDSNIIPSAFPYLGGGGVGTQTCITYEAVNEAYLEARRRIAVKIPADGVWKHDQIASVGEVLLDISAQLAKTYALSLEDIEKGLPQIDTMKTLIAEICPAYLSDVSCQPGKYRRHDGLCNNLEHPTWGATNTPFQRLMAPQYADWMSAPRQSVLAGVELPLPRIVSRTIHPDEGFHDHAGTVMVVAWGQFMDHDFTLTGTPIDRRTKNEPEDCCKKPPHLRNPYCMDVLIPEDDYFYSKYGVRCQDFVRSFPSVRPNCRLGSRTPFNTLTGVIDGNTVYGVTEEFSRHLRAGYGGLLRMNPAFAEFGLKDLLPLKVQDPDEGCTRANSTEFCFEAGEVRVNEQLVLACMHTLMAREHNRLAKELALVNPHWDDETLYQEARRIVIAQIQHITFNEFLPIILGKEVMEKFGLMLQKEGYWDGYDPSVNPNIIEAFAAAAFRFGHSLLPTAVERWSKAHKFIASKRLSDLIRRPYDLYRAGVMDEYLMGLMNQVAQAMDDSITQEVTNHLLKKPGHSFGFDLVAFNMQRGREFGVPGFMHFRKFCGLPEAQSFEDLFGSMPNATVHRYMQIFHHPMDVDLWSGGVSEKPLPGSMIGPTFACLIATQLSYLRRGDRFWYELPNQPSSFTPEQLQEIRKTKLSRIICDNTDLIDTIQVYPMVLPDYEINPRVACRSGVLPSLDLSKWAEFGNETISTKTKKSSVHKLTQAFIKNQTFHRNKSNDIISSTTDNDTIRASSQPVLMMKKDQLKVSGMRSSSINDVANLEKSVEKRGKRSNNYKDFPTSREVPQIKRSPYYIDYPTFSEVPQRKRSPYYNDYQTSSEIPLIRKNKINKNDFDYPTSSEIPQIKRSSNYYNYPTSSEVPQLKRSKNYFDYPTSSEVPQLKRSKNYFDYPTSSEVPKLKRSKNYFDYPTSSEVPQLKRSKNYFDYPTSSEVPQLKRSKNYFDYPTSSEVPQLKRSKNYFDYPTSSEVPQLKRSKNYFDYPTSSEIPLVNDEFSVRMDSSSLLLDSDSFDREFMKTQEAFIGRDKKPEDISAFLYPPFFSSEYFHSSPMSDLSLSMDSPADSKGSEMEEFSDERDSSVSDVSKGVVATMERSAYNLPKPRHDFVPTRAKGQKPVNIHRRLVPTVASFKTSVIHNYPGYALPGSSSGVRSSSNASSSRSPPPRPQIHTHKTNKLVVHTYTGNQHKHNGTHIESTPLPTNRHKGDDDSEEEHHHHHFYDQLKHVHINPPKGFDPDSFRLTLPHFVKKGKYIGKKHKHFHHVDNAPIIIKYDTPSSTTIKPLTTGKPTFHRKFKKDKGLTESQEEAMYDEEGEISEKEIENSYKNYDDSQLTKALDYEAGGSTDYEESSSSSDYKGSNPSSDYKSDPSSDYRESSPPSSHYEGSNPSSDYKSSKPYSSDYRESSPPSSHYEGSNPSSDYKSDPSSVYRESSSPPASDYEGSNPSSDYEDSAEETKVEAIRATPQSRTVNRLSNQASINKYTAKTLNPSKIRNL